MVVVEEEEEEEVVVVVVAAAERKRTMAVYRLMDRKLECHRRTAELLPTRTSPPCVEM